MIEEFFPTPVELIRKMLEGININYLSEVLDACAGKADLCDFINKNRRNNYKINFDVVEINPELQFILKGKKYRLIHDDFLTFRTYKRYDLIIANFPFSCGDQHLNKALDLLDQNGGQLRCLVNAETIRNPYTKLRREVLARLEAIGAEIEFLSDEFLHAERATDVEVALIKAAVQRPEANSVILDFLKKSERREVEENQPQELVERNYINQIIANFNLECEIGIRLIEESFSLKSYTKTRFVKPGERDFTSNIIELQINGNKHNSKTTAINEYLESMRLKYWSLLVEDERFYSQYTSNIVTELRQKLIDLKNYDFTLFNIRALIEDLFTKVNQGVEDSILKIFDEFSRKFSYLPETNNNVHLFNGWKTNQSHRVGKKVIIPMNGAFASYSMKQRLDDYYINERLSDMVKVFNYLADEQINVRQLVGENIELANETVKFTNIDLRYFEVSFYKKGTCHIKFKDQRLLDKLNIYGAQKKKWLPPSYGKKSYSQMDAEEKAVIDSFQGEESYNEVMKSPELYLVPDNFMLPGSMPQLPALPAPPTVQVEKEFLPEIIETEEVKLIEPMPSKAQAETVQIIDIPAVVVETGKGGQMAFNFCA